MAISCVFPAALWGEEPDAAQEEELTLRVYPVGDLVLRRVHHPFQSTIPTTSRAPDRGGVSTAVGVGGGFFQVADTVAQQGTGVVVQGAGDASPADVTAVGSAEPISVNELVDTIQTLIPPEAWEGTGGHGVIQGLGNVLVVRQTASAHKQIEKLLEGLRRAQAKPVTIDAYWLMLDGAQADRLMERAANEDAQGETNETDNGKDNPAAHVVARDVLSALMQEAPHYRGSISCFSGQIVHLVSGSRRTVVTGATPTVGPFAVGYTVMTEAPNSGLLLRVMPTLLGDDRAQVDVQSSYTRWEDPDKSVPVPAQTGQIDLTTGKDIAKDPGKAGESASIDRVNMPAQELGTTVLAPLGRPVLVGGMSLVEKGVEPVRQFYLVIEVSTR